MAHDCCSNEIDGGIAMVKTELRKTIQSRREARGLGDVVLTEQAGNKNIEVKIFLSRRCWWAYETQNIANYILE